jgi:hypothetical protein
LTFEVIEGHGATSLQEFGLGTPSTSSLLSERQVIFQVQLVNEQVSDVLLGPYATTGIFPAGTNLDFYQRSDFAGIHWAFSSQLLSQATLADLEVFTDRNNSLGLGGSVLNQESESSWLLYLDAAGSIDDDDNELVMRMTLNQVPEPSTLTLLGGIFAAAAWTRRRRNQQVSK